ncbi:MAG: hypothetical protein B6241_08295 [Spirochaetaceae bacterium 4572_59]|nr:MAG: hypothetical protein B6241_08295 [Spirochaetaceae bacterium 4572_59]
MKRILFFITSLLVSSFFLTSEEAVELDNGVYAKISTQKGELVFELDYKNLPLTVSNFVAQAEGKMGTPLYQDLSVYRVVPGYALFSGDPDGSGTGGADYTFSREEGSSFSNGTAGALTMESRNGEDHGSRFMILLKGDSFLDRKYTSFGRLIRGVEKLNKIKAGQKISIEILRIGSEANAFQPDKDSITAMIEQAREAERLQFSEKNPEVAGILESLGDGLKQSETGIFYAIHKEGKGGNPRPGDTVRMHYSGHLVTGQEFDNSYQRGEPFSFTIGKDGVIPGWIETALSMQAGEQRTIILPPELGYGDNGYGPIPADSWLIFDIELIDFK